MDPAFLLRPATPDDLPAIADLYSRANPWDPPASADQLRHREATRDPSLPHLRLVADESGRVVGAGSAGSVPYWRRDLIVANVYVDPPAQRRGLGAVLFARLLAFAQEHGAEMCTWVNEENEAGIAFARRRGFAETYRVFESALDVAEFDVAPFAFARERIEAAGIAVATLAGDDSPAARRAAYDLWARIEHDVPSPDPFLVPPFEQWEEQLLRGPEANLDAFFLARAGAGVVGLAYLTTPPGRPAYNLLTGVDRAHRGTGIALALKLETIRYAREHGIAVVRTTNHTTNAAMLALNERLGYRRLPGRIRMGRPL